MVELDTQQGNKDTFYALTATYTSLFSATDSLGGGAGAFPYLHISCPSVLHGCKAFKQEERQEIHPQENNRDEEVGVVRVSACTCLTPRVTLV